MEALLENQDPISIPKSLVVLKVAAEAVELPPDLTPDDMGKKFRVTTPLVEVDAAGRRRERGQATTEREVAPVRVGSQGSGGVRAPPGKPSPQTPAASR